MPMKPGPPHGPGNARANAQVGRKQEGIFVRRSAADARKARRWTGTDHNRFARSLTFWRATARPDETVAPRCSATASPARRSSSASALGQFIRLGSICVLCVHLPLICVKNPLFTLSPRAIVKRCRVTAGHRKTTHESRKIRTTHLQFEPHPNPHRRTRCLVAIHRFEPRIEDIIRMRVDREVRRQLVGHRQVRDQSLPGGPRCRA
jgi:hypothetical protein